MEQQPKQIYRSMQGKEVDMNRLVNVNELTPAVGNLKINARGDELGAGGRIIRKREDILREAEANRIVPDQINIRAVEEEVVTAKPVIAKKNVADMDPEGNE
jgi:hypothetical protein